MGWSEKYWEDVKSELEQPAQLQQPPRPKQPTTESEPVREDETLDRQPATRVPADMPGQAGSG